MYLVLMIIITMFFIFINFKRRLSNNFRDIFSNRKYIKNLENTNMPEEFIMLYQDIEKDCNAQLKKLRKRLIIIITITVILIIAIIFVIPLISNTTISNGRISYHYQSGISNDISEIIVFLIVIVGIFFYTINNIKYKKIYKDNFVRSFIHYLNPNLEYKPEGDIRIEELYKKAKFDNKFFNSFYEDDCISGFIDKNINIKLCDISIERDGGKHRKIIKRGLFTYIESSAKLPEELIINTHNINSGNDDKVELDNEEFETYYNIYCCSKILAYQVLTHDVMDELLRFYKDLNVDFEIVLRGNKIYIMFHTGKMFEPKIFSTKNNIQILWAYYNVTNFIINFITKINKELQNLNI